MFLTFFWFPGQYECRVSHGELSRNKSVMVVIKKGPVLEEFNFPKNLELGMRARLVCKLKKFDQIKRVQAEEFFNPQLIEFVWFERESC